MGGASGLSRDGRAEDSATLVRLSTQVFMARPAITRKGAELVGRRK
jgi:hypothetical protein